MIGILTGPIRTGKTTTLLHTFGADGRGVVQPVINGRRHVLDLASGEARPLEAGPTTPVVHRVPVGRFIFDGATFAWAHDRLDDAMQTADHTDWLVLDEAGPLELAGQGLASAVEALVAYADGGGQVLLVVRAGLVEAVVKKFHIHRPLILQLGDTLPDGRRLAGP